MIQTTLRAAIAAALVPGAAHLGLFQTWGAHPWWDLQVAWIGAPIGLALALVLARRSAIIGLALPAGLTALALVAASTGKTRFAASFAEDALAGTVWYYGWIAAALFAAATLAGGAARLIAAKPAA